jgi:choline transporter-like protein 2/4/5
MSSIPADFDMKKMSDRKYKGEDYNVNPDILNDPFNRRKCTDVLMGLFFFAFLCGMGFMTAIGYINGSPGELLAPIDSNNQICGYSPGTEGYPYLYIYDVTSALMPPVDFFGYTTCVQSCPETATSPLECLDVAACTNPANDRYGTYSIMGYCIPDTNTLPSDLQASWTAASQNFLNSASGAPIYDVYKARWIIFSSVWIAIFFAFVYIKFMDWCALQCAWISVVTVGLGLIGFGTLCWVVRNSELQSANPNETSITWLFWGSIIFWVVSALYCLCLACNLNSLRVSIRIIETAGDFFADTKRVALVPVFFFFLAIGTTFAWLYGYICVTSIGTITVEAYQFQTKNVEYTSTVANMLWIMIFGYFWIMAFLLSCNEFVIVVSAASWYFSNKEIPDSDGIPGDSEVMKGFIWIPRYHFGSLALGSLMIAIVWIIRFIFEYVAKKIDDASGGNKFTKCLLCCIRCCLDCFDRFMRYLTRNAYIYMAISSESFCSSALNAFILMLKNSAKFAFVEGFSDVFMFIAKICISVFATVTSMLILRWTT